MIRRNAYTAEQDEWLRENAPGLSRKAATELFNSTFGEHRSEGSLKVHCNKILGVGFANVKAGMANGSALPIGTERVRCGYVWVKVKGDKPEDGKKAGYANWRQKAQIVYETANGPIPKGYLVVYLNRDTMDCRPENLYAISPQVNREMGKKQWWNENPELTLAAIKWCELFYTLKEFRS